MNQDGLICSLINANNGNVYAGLFEICEGKTLKSKLDFLSFKDSNGDISLNPLRDFVEENNEFSNISFIGDGAILYKDLIEKMIFKNMILLLLKSKFQLV